MKPGRGGRGRFSTLLVVAGLTGCAAIAPLAPVGEPTGPGADPPVPRPVFTLPPASEVENDPFPLIGPIQREEGFEQSQAAWRDAAAGSWASPSKVLWRRLEGAFCGGQYVMQVGVEGFKPFDPMPAECLLTEEATVSLAGMQRPHLRFSVFGVAYPPESLRLQAEAREAGTDGWAPVGPSIRARHYRTAVYSADLTRWVDRSVQVRFRATLAPGDKPTRGLLLDDIALIEPRNLHLAPSPRPGSSGSGLI